MTECLINGVPVKFPFEPYELQKNYMEKVLECLQNDKNGVLESPTGTGKTLSLLCSSLAWLEMKKAQIQAETRIGSLEPKENKQKDGLCDELNLVGKFMQGDLMWQPKIIYASRTHSQLSQAMQELKRTAYSYMKATVIGSRDQMCIHPEIKAEESNAIKIHLCQLKVKSKSCYFHNRVETQKVNPAITQQPVLDIEDLIGLGEKHKFCPYYMSKELKEHADIVFMPYNYLLDARTRKAVGINLANSVIILDEAHNVEKICEESASLQIKSTDITLGIEEVTEIMKAISDENNDFNFMEAPMDFTADDLCTLKQMFLDFEKALDEIKITINSEGQTFEGNYIFEILSKAGVKDENVHAVMSLTEKLTQFLTTVNKGPFARKGHGLQCFEDMLRIAFAGSGAEFKEKIQRCYKVHIIDEDPKKKEASNWLSKTTPKKGNRVLSYWCFSPGFGMNILMACGIKCVILTSGTLAPLKPLITELELEVDVQLENPHIVKGNQICVKILSKGPDGQQLNCSYQNRNNPQYIKSLGMTINNLVRIIPNGLLIFFPSYPIMAKFKNDWQESGIWSSIDQQKQIFVEPKQKLAFQEAMNSFYSAVTDPKLKGAIFMGVCRGKVSEGLDFADANGRAVIVVGLPYPPLKDPRVILKKKYLDFCRSKNREFIGGEDWYGLEATKAVNQAIGRVIRHQRDYGAIILLDSRFNSPRVVGRMSLWLRHHIKHTEYGPSIRDLRLFFDNACKEFPIGASKPAQIVAQAPASFNNVETHKRNGNFDFSTSQTCAPLNTASSSQVNSVNINAQEDIVSNPYKRKKINVIPNEQSDLKQNLTISKDDIKEYLSMVKRSLSSSDYQEFVKTVKKYRDEGDFTLFSQSLDKILLSKPSLRFIILGLQPYIKTEHKLSFEEYWSRMR